MNRTVRPVLSIACLIASHIAPSPPSRTSRVEGRSPSTGTEGHRRLGRPGFGGLVPARGQAAAESRKKFSG
jgi:hypothetical protein